MVKVKILIYDRFNDQLIILSYLPSKT